MRKWKCLFVSSCACKILISNLMEFWNSCQDRTKASMLLGVVLENNDTSGQWGTFNIVMTSLVILCPLQPYLLNIPCVESVEIVLTKVCVCVWNSTGPTEGTCRWRWTTCLVLPHRVTRSYWPLLSWVWRFRGLVCLTNNQRVCTLFCVQGVPDLHRLKLHGYMSRVHFLFKQIMGFDLYGH